MDLWDLLAQRMTHPSTLLCIPGTCPCPGRVCSVSPVVPGKVLRFQEEVSQWERSRAEVRLAWGA